MRVLWALVHALETTSKRMNQEIGVTGSQRLVLRVVGLFPELSAGELAAILHVHPSTLTGVLRRLATHQLLERSAAPDDRRRAVLRLTSGGQRINRARHGTVEAAVDRALRHVTNRDRAAARRVLTAVTRRLESAGRARRTPRAARREVR